MLNFVGSQTLDDLPPDLRAYLPTAEANAKNNLKRADLANGQKLWAYASLSHRFQRPIQREESSRHARVVPDGSKSGIHASFNRRPISATQGRVGIQ